MEDILNQQGEIDFEKLNPGEREEYMKAVELVSSSQITLADFHKHITKMREAVERAIIEEPDFIYSLPFPFLKRHNPKIVELRARLKNYLIFEGFFERPETAKAQLDLYKKRLKIK